MIEMDNEQILSSYITGSGAAGGNDPGSTQAPKGKKKHTGLIFGISAAVVVLIGIAAAWIFAKDLIVNKWMLMTKTDLEYFRWVAGREVDTVCRYVSIADAAGAFKQDKTDDAGRAVDMRLDVKLSEEFTDMLNIYPIRDMELDSSCAVNENGISIALRPSYNSAQLFSLTCLYDSASSKVLAELPDYKEGIVDLSSLLEMKIADDKTVNDMIGEYAAQAKEKMAAYSGFDAAAFEEDYRKYTDILINSIENVELLKKSYAAVGEESVKCTEIRISVSAATLRAQLKTLTDMLWETYSQELNKTFADAGLDKKGVQFTKEDIYKAIDGISDEVSGRLVLYVDSRARLIAIDASGNYSTTQAGAKIRWEKAENGVIRVKIGLLFNQLNAADIDIEIKGKSVTVKLTPDAFVDVFLGNYSGLSAEYIYSGNDDQSEPGKTVQQNTLRLYKSGNVIAEVSSRAVIGGFTGHLIGESGKTVYSIDDAGSGYIDLQELVGFGLKLLDKINEPVLEEKINEMLAGFGFDLDKIREMYDSGMLDIIGGLLGPGILQDDEGKDIQTEPDSGYGTGTDESNSPTDTENGEDVGSDPVNTTDETSETGDENGDASGADDAGDPADTEAGTAAGTNAGEEEPDEASLETGTAEDDTASGNGSESDTGDEKTAVQFPVTRREAAVEIPNPLKKYSYSFAGLAAYAKPGDYKGRTFIKPASREITPEAFEALKDDYLAEYGDKILVDQETATVEWGDEVYIDIVPYVFGMTVESFHYRDSYVKMGDQMYGENLDEELIGMKVGDSKSITAKLNEQYGEFAGIEATFLVTINKIDRYIIPAWTEEFICGYLGYESLDACGDMLLNRLEVQNEVSDEDIADALKTAAMSDTVFSEVPKSVYDVLWNRYYNDIYDMTEAQYRQTPEAYFAEQGMSENEVYAMLDSDLKMNLKDYCFYAAIAEAENISVTGADAVSLVEAEMNERGCSTYEDLMKQVSLENIIDNEIEKRIRELILSTAIITEQ